MKRPEPEEVEDLDVEFEAVQSDLTNYENPYKKKFRPVQNAKSTEDLFETRYSFSFVGFENLDLSHLPSTVGSIQTYNNYINHCFEECDL